MQNKVHILSTGPLNEALIKKAALKNIIIDEVSFIETEEMITDAIEEKIKELSRQNITAVFTSMNAVKAVENFISSKPSWNIYCVGNTSKKLLQKIFGEQNISGTAENANQLADLMLKNSSLKNIIFFCGDKRREDLPEKLKKNGIGVAELIVYKTVETPKKILTEYNGILFFSPSAVQSFFSKNSITNVIRLFAIGTTTAKEIKHFTAHPVIIAETPGKENLVNLAIEYFSRSKIL